MPGVGVEPTSLARHDFKSCAYTSSATRPRICSLVVKHSLASLRTTRAARIQLFSCCAAHKPATRPDLVPPPWNKQKLKMNKLLVKIRGYCTILKRHRKDVSIYIWIQISQPTNQHRTSHKIKTWRQMLFVKKSLGYTPGSPTQKKR